MICAHLFCLLFRGSVPPGARFDPIGPFGSLPVRPPGPGGRGGPRGLHGGDPDNDELSPPVSVISFQLLTYTDFFLFE